jgi:hypothetical protein
MRQSAADMLTRQNNARERFIETARNLSGLDRATIEKALVVFLARKLVRLDAVNGSVIVKTGQVYDRSVLIDFAS